MPPCPTLTSRSSAGIDASHYDAPPTARDGIGFYVHKACEGHRYYTDNEYGASLTAARKLGIPVLGAYFVPHGGTTADQVDFLLSVLDGQTPWWRQHPAWMLQIDAEKFGYMDRAPTIAEVNAFADEYVKRTGRPASSVFAYAPKWLYGDKVSSLRYAVWASDYGTNPAGHYPDVYPGNTSARWAAYGGKTPTILQYGSKTTIAGQTTCDANAYRGTLDQLTALITGGSGMDQSTPLREKTRYKVRDIGYFLGDVLRLRDWGWLHPSKDYGGLKADDPALNPDPESRIVKAYNAITATADGVTTLLGRPPVESAPVDPETVAAALQTPAGQAALRAAVKAELDARDARLAAALAPPPAEG